MRHHEPVGTFCLVLHTHLPWVAHAGAWPVGEEWLHQAFTGSWRRVVEVLDRLALEGRRDLLTLGVTPVTAAMLDDEYCLRELHSWIGGWLLRAHSLATRREPHLRALAAHEHREATTCLAEFEARWRHGGSAVLRPLVDDGVVELLGGPLTHPFSPLLRRRFQRFALRAGLDDTTLRLGRAPRGIWAPECAYAPGLEESYAAAGVERFIVDGPTLRGETAQAHPVGSSSVVAFGRDLTVSYRVWSPRAGYPGHRHYRDFHTFDHASGFRPARVTGRRIPPEEKAPWEPASAFAQARRDAMDFVGVVRDRLTHLHDRHERPGLVVAAYDTELFGHWWHEGPVWLEEVLRRLPEAGVRVTTLHGAIEAGCVGAPRELPPGSWGSGKDWRVWSGEPVSDLVTAATEVQERLEKIVDRGLGDGRNAVLDQLAREALLACASDWAFLVTKDTAAEYARHRADEHVQRFHRLADLLDRGAHYEAEQYAARLAVGDGIGPAVDARLL
jgi:1,4-alpha-glucan branching enzyme